MRKFVLGLGSLPFLAALALLVSGHGYIFTALARTYLAGHSTANIDDHAVFDTRTIEAGEPQPWPRHPGHQPLPQAIVDELTAGDAVAFLVIQDGRLLAEDYFQGYDRDSRTNSFSMAKTIVTMLVGRAIDDGLIERFDQPLTDWLPEFSDDANGRRATLASLSSMTSGYVWDEHYYSPLSPTVELLYGDDIADFLFGGVFDPPGSDAFYYSSASTQLLAIALQRALAKRDPSATLSDYLSDTLWRPLGMNDDGLWHTDGSGMELAFCCISTNARNFAKFGQLLLQDGRWRGEALLGEAFVEAMRTPGAVDHYGYSTWLRRDGDPAYYYLSGHLGQFVLVVPDERLVVVRLGRSHGEPNDKSIARLDRYVAIARSLAASQ